MKKLSSLILVLGICALLGPAQTGQAGRFCTYCWTGYNACMNDCSSSPYLGCEAECVANREECLSYC